MSPSRVSVTGDLGGEKSPVNIITENTMIITVIISIRLVPSFLLIRFNIFLTYLL